MPICNFFQDRRFFVPCFSISHSPGPHSFKPVLSTSSWIAPPGARCRQRYRYGTPAERGVVGHRQIKMEKLKDRADQPFGLAQRQAKHRAQRQGRRDREIRITGLPARRGARRRLPGRNLVIGEPDGQAAALAQCRVVLRPIRHPPLRPRDMMATSGVGLMRHG
jgi:hypothetical protein